MPLFGLKMAFFGPFWALFGSYSTPGLCELKLAFLSNLLIAALLKASLMPSGDFFSPDLSKAEFAPAPDFFSGWLSLARLLPGFDLFLRHLCEADLWRQGRLFSGRLLKGSLSCGSDFLIDTFSEPGFSQAV